MIQTDFKASLLAFHEVGGYNELIRKFFISYPDADHTAIDPFTNKSCAQIPKDSMHLFRSIVPGESDLPWTGAIFGISVSAIWYWCSDQVQFSINAAHYRRPMFTCQYHPDR